VLEGDFPEASPALTQPVLSMADLCTAPVEGPHPQPHAASLTCGGDVSPNRFNDEVSSKTGLYGRQQSDAYLLNSIS
jgi:hypothetical protein